MSQSLSLARVLRAVGLAPTAAGLAIAAIVPTARAAWSPDPNLGALPVCTQSASQLGHQVCADGSGGAIIVWQDLRAVGGDIYVQRVNAAGVPLWTANGVALCTAANDQQFPMLVPDGTGGAIVTWQDLRTGTSFDVYAQRVNASGVPQWTANGVAVSTAVNGQNSPVIAGDGAGGAIVSWVDARVSAASTDIYAQRLSSTGTALWAANGVALCTAANAQDGVQIVSDGAGGAIATWHDYRTISASHIYAQRVNATGTPQWTTDGAAICTATGQQYFAVITTDMTGGAIIGWEDTRNSATTGTDFYAQHVSGAGVTQWTANGVVVAARTGTQGHLRMASDGFGGALFVFTDFAVTSGDVYGQRLSAGGAHAWGSANGIAVLTAANEQSDARVVADGAGGAIVVCHDLRGGVNYDVYAQRITATGTAIWGSAPVGVSTANAAQFTPQLATDADGGAFVVWGDTRNSPSADIYVQRLRHGGALGQPEPRILSVRDVPNDQGGQIRLAFAASHLDTPADPFDVNYVIWRSVPMHALASRRAALQRGITTDAVEAARSGRLWAGPFAVADYAWESVNYVSASGFPEYSVVVGTTSDSLAGSNPRTAFMVQLQTRPFNTYFLYESAADSGYSVDNIAPFPPAPFASSYENGVAHLSWVAGGDPDLEHYRVHRGVSPDFTPSAATWFATVQEPNFDDAAGSPYVYKVVAVDTHGNESPAATFVLGGTVGAPVAGVTALAFAPPSPNPARGATTLRFALPAAGHVRLAMFDAGGRRVRTVEDGTREPGVHRVALELTDDDGRPLANGLYMVRLETAGRVLTRRVIAVR